MRKPNNKELEDIKKKYIDATDNVLLDNYNRPYIQTENGKMYLSSKNKYNYTIKN